MTNPIKFDMRYYFNVRDYLDSNNNLRASKPIVGEDSRVYINSWKNRDHVITGLKLSVVGSEGIIKPLNGHPIPEEIKSDLQKIIEGKNE